MRARYTAYATQRVDFLLASHHPDTVRDVDVNAARRLSRHAKWNGLEIVSTEGGLAGDDEGWVEFVAHYTLEGRDVAHHERSLFRRHHGRWYFHSDDRPKQTTARNASPKVGRNEPCPCGSGKKYKKCCGAVTQKLAPSS